jgi:hypothetical protein
MFAAMRFLPPYWASLYGTEHEISDTLLLPPLRPGVKFTDGVQIDSAKPVTHSTDSQPREAA